MDYSKWDKLDAGDDDEGPGPRVTRLDKPSTVTIGGQHGFSVGAAPVNPKKAITAAPSVAKKGATDYAKWDRIAADVSDDEQEAISDGEYDTEDEPGFDDDDDGMYKVDEDETMKKHTLIGEGAPGSSKAPAAAHQVPLEEALSAAKKSMNRKDGGEQGGSAAASSSSASSSGDAAGRQQDGASSSKNMEQALSKNGGKADTHIWSQDKTSVVVGVYAPLGTKAKSVSVAVSEGNELVVKIDGNAEERSPWLSKRLAYPVSIDPEDGVDWELKDFGEGRIVKITLVKQLPGMSNLPALEVQSSVVLWWKRAFEGDEAIDVEAISDRPAAANRAANANAWQEAHQQFRDMVKNHEPMEI